MQDVEQLRRELEAMSPEDRAERIQVEQEKAKAAEDRGLADPEATAALEEIAANAAIHREHLRLREPGAARERVAELLADILAQLDQRAEEHIEAFLEQRAERLAATLNHVDQVWHREMAGQPRRAFTGPQLDTDRLCAAVWNATQEAGAPTAAGDAAVQVLRDAWEPR